MQEQDRRFLSTKCDTV